MNYTREFASESAADNFCDKCGYHCVKYKEGNVWYVDVWED